MCSKKKERERKIVSHHKKQHNIEARKKKTHIKIKEWGETKDYLILYENFSHICRGIT